MEEVLLSTADKSIAGEMTPCNAMLLQGKVMAEYGIGIRLETVYVTFTAVFLL